MTWRPKNGWNGFNWKSFEKLQINLLKNVWKSWKNASTIHWMNIWNCFKFSECTVNYGFLDGCLWAKTKRKDLLLAMIFHIQHPYWEKIEPSSSRMEMRWASEPSFNSYFLLNNTTTLVKMWAYLKWEKFNFKICWYKKGDGFFFSKKMYT